VTLFNLNLIHDQTVEGIFAVKLALFHAGDTELQMCENCCIVLCVNILMGVAH